MFDCGGVSVVGGNPTFYPYAQAPRFVKMPLRLAASLSADDLVAVVSIDNP
jgi:hypothetical protein